MLLDDVKNLIPEYAKDLKLNLGNVLAQPELNETQTYGVALSCALAAGNKPLIEAISEVAKAKISPEAFVAAQTAASIMAMNNIYYKFPYLVGKDKYSTIPANLRMNGMRTHGHDRLDFELFSLAVSVINSCVFCVKAHEKLLIEGGFTEEKILAAVRIAAVINAIAKTI